MVCKLYHKPHTHTHTVNGEKKVVLIHSVSEYLGGTNVNDL